MLFLSGQFDPIVSPSWAAAAQRSIAHSKHLTFPNVGHGALHIACGWKVAATFIANPAELPVDACFDEQVPPRFGPDATSLVRKALGRLHEN